MKIQSIMVKPVVTVREDATLEEAARLMLDHDIGCVPVVNAREELCGIVTESDFTGKVSSFPFSPLSLYGHPQILGEWLPKQGIERIYQNARTKKVREFMTQCVVTASEDDTVETVVEQMTTCNLQRIPVVCGNRLVGIVTRHELLRLMVS
jgi:CBS domain-containing protein